MKGPHADAGAFARNWSFEDTTRVPQKPSNINNKVSMTDLIRSYPIIAAHWFGIH